MEVSDPELPSDEVKGEKDKGLVSKKENEFNLIPKECGVDSLKVSEKTTYFCGLFYYKIVNFWC